MSFLSLGLFLKSSKPNLVFNISLPYPVSVLIPIYNKIGYLQRSYGSLQNQTISYFEIIAIDDYSNDGSFEFYLSKIKNNKRLRLIHHLYNQGIYASRYHGVKFSKALYIMSLDPDDAYYNYTIESAFNAAIQSNADILEFQIAAKHRNYTHYDWVPCRASYNNCEILLSRIQGFRFGNPNWNIFKKIIKRTIYLKAFHLFNPFVKDKIICFHEDLIQFSGALIFSRNFICAKIMGYLYFRDLPDSGTSKGYVSRNQKKMQDLYIKSVIRYVYENRNNLSNVNVNDFFNISENLNAYNKLKSFDKSAKRNCSILDGYLNIDFSNDGYCIYML